MSGIQNERVQLGQENGPDVELVVSGTKLYANYETPDGYPVIYDDQLGLYCYTRVVDGRYQSTGVPLSEPPPEGVTRHARESDEVRKEIIRTRKAQRERQAQSTPEKTKRSGL